jgi:hypothetical protein
VPTPLFSWIFDIDKDDRLSQYTGSVTHPLFTEDGKYGTFALVSLAAQDVR